MALIPKRADDYVINNLSNADTGGRGLVEVYALVGPDRPTITSDRYQSKAVALKKGKELASKANVSLWYVDKPQAEREEAVLVESYRNAGEK